MTRFTFLLFLSACSVHFPTPPSGELICKFTSHCRTGFVCHEGFCVDAGQSLESLRVCDEQSNTALCPGPEGIRTICVDGDCVESTCGDGVRDVGTNEFCDDGLGEGESFCLDDCSAIQTCGNFIIEGTETCDDGDTLDTSNGCFAQCQRDPAAVCGDGVYHSGIEECDDANDVPGDGCHQCQLEDNWKCQSQLLTEDPYTCVLVREDCTEQMNFTRCDVDTTSTDGFDRAYDICKAGVCVSPGCNLGRECVEPGANFPLTDPHVGEFVFDSSSPTEPIMIDSVSGLIWQGGDASYPMRLTWDDAQRYCEDLNWGGRHDWSVPNIHELQSILGFTDPKFPQRDEEYWTSTTHMASDWAWAVSFNTAIQAYQKINLFLVRCVIHSKHTSFPLQSSVPIEDPYNQTWVVSDSEHNLIWEGRSILSTSLRGQAEEYCANFTWSAWGLTGWRLPTINELRSIMSAEYSPTFDPALFPSETTHVYWTSTIGSSGEDWGLRGNDGALMITGSTEVLCVLALENVE